MAKNIIFKGFLLLSICCFINTSILAQEEQPAQPEQPQQPTTTTSSGTIDQITTGIYNYGFLESVYYQFTGDSDFKEGTLPTTYLMAGSLPISIPYVNFDIPALSFTWDRIGQFDWDMPGGWSYGFELHNYYATSESTLVGGGEFEAPDVKMEMHLWSFFFKVFILDPIDSPYQPYVGVGWGIINGSFDSKTLAGKEYETSYYGGQSSRMIGIQLKADADWGGVFEIRTTTAYATTSNDPFNQADAGDDLQLNFSGSLVSMCAYYRF